MKIKLPEIAFPLKDDLIRSRDAYQKEKMKAYVDQRISAEHSLLKVDDRVLVRQPKLSKLTPPFSVNPYTIITIKGNQITAKHGRHWITRNSSYFKLVPDRKADPEGNSSDDDDDDGGEVETKQMVPSSTESTTEIAQPGRQQLIADTKQPTTTHRRYPQRNRRPIRFFMDS